MWRDIFTTNRAAVTAALDAFSRRLSQFRSLLAANDSAGLERLLTRAKTRRDTTIVRRLTDHRLAAE
jgi:prephenate dehydrogenase